MTDNYRKFRKGPRMRTRRTHQAVTSEKDFNGRRDHEATLALNPGPRRRRPGLAETVACKTHE